MKTKKRNTSYLGAALILASSELLSAATILTNNVLSSSVSASGSYLTNTAINAFDDAPGTIWLSGSFPTAWIEVDLGSSYSISEGYFSVNMSPNGNANHQIWISDNPILAIRSGRLCPYFHRKLRRPEVLTPAFSPVEGRYVQNPARHHRQVGLARNEIEILRRARALVLSHAWPYLHLYLSSAEAFLITWLDSRIAYRFHKVKLE